jgi:Cdc6-like AAA superfamily ATPase
MDIRQETIVKYSNEILDYLLKFKEENPEFTFSLRQRDSVQSKEKRLEEGQWFQGSNYILVPLFKKGDDARKVKTIGFQIVFDHNGNIKNNFIEISFKSGIDDHKEIQFYKKLCDYIDLVINDKNHGIKEYSDKDDIWNNLKSYITDFRQYALMLLDEFDLKSKYLVSETDFQKNLHRIEQIKKNITREGLVEKNAHNYWIFQGSPKIFDMVSALEANAIKTWTVSSHKGKIVVDDKIILWLTGSNSGCYALGKVTSPVAYIKEENSEIDFYLNPTEKVDNNRVSIEIEHNYFNNPVLWETIKDDDVFNDFKGGGQGTNFTANKEQYETLIDLFSSNKEGAYAAVKKVLDPEKLKSFLEILRGFIKENGTLPNDERISFNVRKNKNKLVFLIGNRYSLCIEKKQNKTVMSFISKDAFSEKSEVFNNHKGEIDAHWNFVDNLEEYKSQINESFLIQLDRFNKCPARKYTNQDFINDVYQNDRVMINKLKKPLLALNQILYGPPGTGKTYRLQNEFFEKFTVKESSLTREQYLESIVADLSWWQVISIAVLDLGESKVNDIHNHEFVKFKEKLSSSKTVRPTIWGQLQSHTVRDCPNVNVVSRSEPLFFNKSKDSKWTIDEVLLEEYYPESIELLAISKGYKPSDDITIKNYDFVTFHQSFSYEDFVEGIKPRLDEGETEVAFEIKDGIFKKLCIKAEADPKNKYAIFIDEINRGNVSAIFGELITLIEDDKRLGAANELKVKLPYSKRELGVPSNLSIIGTMNTADRSVEALDTALRRRFSFSEIMPNPELLEEIQFNSFNLSEVLKTINERIEVLLDRDHTIGHSYFLKVKDGDIESLNSVFKNNIFPLLQEYFYHDYEKIALILGEGFVRIKENQTVKFAKFNDITTPDIATQFELIDKIEDIEAAVHLLLNRNV